MTSTSDRLKANDAVWAAFYRDGKTLGEICQQFECGVYDLSPWLTAPLVRSALGSSQALTPSKEKVETAS